VPRCRPDQNSQVQDTQDRRRDARCPGRRRADRPRTEGVAQANPGPPGAQRAHKPPRGHRNCQHHSHSSKDKHQPRPRRAHAADRSGAADNGPAARPCRALAENDRGRQCDGPAGDAGTRIAAPTRRTT
jgi:hypothetical protein